MQPMDVSDRPAHPLLRQLAHDLLVHGQDLPLFVEPRSLAASSEDADRTLTDPDLMLSLDDMIGDGNGNIVLLNDAGLTRVAIATDADVMTRGIVLDHCVATGEDVSGFAYVKFATGLTLYYPEGVELAVLPHA